MTLAVMTIWTDPPEWCLLAESARHFAIPLMMTQQASRWVNFSHNKVDIFFAGLRDVPADRILYVDGDDVVFVRPDAIPVAEAALAECGRDFLVGGEVTCWPWSRRHTHRFPGRSAMRYPNAGCWIATRDGVEREFLAMMSAKRVDDGYVEDDYDRQNCDQPMFHEAVLRGTMAVDTTSRLVLNLNELGLSDSEALHRIFQRDGPAILHGSGRAKGQLRRLWQRLLRLVELERMPRCGLPDSDTDAHPVDGIRGLREMLVTLPPLGRVAEVGCFRGVSTEVFALLAREVVAIDSWEGLDNRQAQTSFKTVADRYANITCVQARSPGAASQFPNGHFDLVYIDGDHSDESVRADLIAWIPKVRAGGWLAGHDFSHESGTGGVIRAVNEVLGKPQRVFSDRSWLVRLPEKTVKSATITTPTSRSPATLSVIIPTIGRPTLTRALASIAAQGDLSGVEVIVAMDGACPNAPEQFRRSQLPGCCVELPGPHRDWGHTPVNLVTSRAQHRYLMRLDDDNIYLPGAFRAVRAAIAENPDRPHIFRVRRGPPHRDLFWTTPEIRVGNVDSHMFVVPNIPGRVGQWGSRYEGDFDFIRETATLHPADAVVWRRESIAVWRPGPFRFPNDVAGWLTPAEGRTLFALATGVSVLEIGTFAGRSAICMAQSATMVFCLDPFDGRGTPTPRLTLAECLENATRYKVADRIRPLVGTSESVGPVLHDTSFEMVFVDGDHTQEAVANDLKLARRVLSPGGRIVCHDYRGESFPGVEAAIQAAGLIVEATCESLAICRLPSESED
ncbi:MAG: class I SAM-dependent methyltransferase [Planctomycetes bacterium]|nr:class I SAM-dependent methyltransferase [Planctomycetota bacterium]